MGWLFFFIFLGLCILVALWFEKSKKKDYEILHKTEAPDFASSNTTIHTTKYRYSPSEIFKAEHISYSRIKLYIQCPRKFELIYLQGYEEEIGRAAKLGNIVHEMLREYMLRKVGYESEPIDDRSRDQIMSSFNTAKESLSIDYLINTRDVAPYIDNFVMMNINSDIEKILYLEEEFESMIQRYKVKCVPDRIEKTNNNKLRIVDYKTGKKEYVDKKQLEMYGLIMSEFEGTNIELEFQFLKTGERMRWAYSDILGRNVFTWVMNYIKEIESSNYFPQKRAVLCNYCGVSQYCY